MINTLKTSLKYAEYLLVLTIIFYWYFTSNLFNPIAIGLLVVMALQIIFKNKVSGIMIPLLFILLSLYMLLALLSELREFSAFNADAKTMLISGLLYLGFTIMCATGMFLNYFRKLIQ
ncbi:hypothetical protein H1R17_01120 [Flavobacterium sp. xlx-214]|uniref:hypothetical protein n=1 Tax=unclassified Flavobacterium TaxID=196869 RepID=UPI0013D3483C|nr:MULTISPECIES: hypothetical protein [unclassified Flavobacterium]MBA5792620.1 hypothetical protein [Flavobacterium sp. xlx-221]QMI83769.1 hypothetical protein H1R17_01120 [Flavobacterium sp. xlx-214]